MNARSIRHLVGIRSAQAWLVAGLALLAPSRALAHCDTLDGPVVKDARDH